MGSRQLIMSKPNPSRVAVIACRSYDPAAVTAAVHRGVELLGGVAALFQPGERILLKPNMAAACPPEQAVTTHPAVFRATAALLRDAGIEVSYGDSPTIGTARRTAVRCGILREARELGIPMADFETAVTVSFPEALLLKQLHLASAAVHADGIISLPKMKTHALTRITGAIKNQIGCVPGFLKSEYHVRMPDIERFCQVLVDITQFLRPRLYVMDGIHAMCGNGPRGGDVYPMQVLLFSQDPVAMDAVFCKLIDIDPEWVPTMIVAQESGLGTCRTQDVELVGDELSTLIRSDFPVKRAPVRHTVSLAPGPKRLKQWITPRPRFDHDACTSCGDCIRQCPIDPKALRWFGSDGSAVPKCDYDRCIRCYCCQEVCGSRAITVETPVLGRLIHRLLD